MYWYKHRNCLKLPELVKHTSKMDTINLLWEALDRLFAQPSPDFNTWQTAKAGFTSQPSITWDNLHAALGVLQGSLSSQSVEPFRFIVEIYDICCNAADKGGGSAFQYLIKEYYSPVVTLDDIARRYSDVIVDLVREGLGDPTLGRFKWEFFNKHAFLCLGSLLKSGVFQTPLGPDSTNKVADFIQALYSRGFVFKEDSVASIFTNDVYKDLILVFDSDEVVKLKEFLESVQRLSYFAPLPEIIATLQRAGITSARAVAKNSDFDKLAASLGIEDFWATAIQVAAALINQRNDEIWFSLLKGRLDHPLSAVVDPASQDLDADPNIEVNFTNLFKDVNSVHTDEAYSVTSASAYLVDLLEYLKESQIPNSSPTKTLQDELLRRRPDISNLELSKDNTFNLVPYSTIVQETMETFISTLPTITAAKAGNQNGMPAGQDVYKYVYGTQLQSVLTPLPSFPYNDATRSIRAFIEGTGISLVSFQQAFKKQLSLVDQKQYVSYFRQFYRQIDASRANLTREDFGIITGKPYSLEDGSETALGVKSAGLFWGYEAADSLDANSIMASSKGLQLIQQEFMAKSGLSFAEVVEILRTKFFARHLVVTSTTGGFTEDLSQFRLQNSPVTNLNITDPLDVTTCFNLQAFIRLRKALNWTTPNLDAALSALAHIEFYDVSGSSYKISPETVSALGAINELSAKTKIDVQTLSLLWVDMDGFFDNSFYLDTFLGDQILLMHPELFVYQTGVISQSLILEDYHQLLESLLGVSTEQLDAILTVTSLQSPSTLWTLQTVSKIFRCNLQSQIFKYSRAEHFAVFESILLSEGTSCSTPQSTLAFYDRWQNLTKDPWSPSTILEYIHATPPAPGSDDSNLISLSTAVAIYGIDKLNAENMEKNAQLLPGAVQPADPSVTLRNSINALFPKVKMDVLIYFLDKLLYDSLLSGALLATSNFAIIHNRSDFSALGLVSSQFIPSDTSGVYNPSGTKFRLKLDCSSMKSPGQDLVRNLTVFKIGDQIVNVDTVIISTDTTDPLATSVVILSQEVQPKGDSFSLLQLPDLASLQLEIKDVSALVLVTEDSEDPQPIFVSKSFTDGATSLLGQLTSVFDIVGNQNYQLIDLNSVLLSNIHWNALQFKDLEKVKTYTSLRRLAGGDRSKLAISMKLCAAPTKDTILNILPKALADTSTFPEQKLRDYISAIYGTLSDDELSTTFADGSELLKIISAMNLIQKIGFTRASIAQLVGWAHCTIHPDSSLEFKAVSEIKNLLGNSSGTAANKQVLAKADSTLAPTRRKALSDFLLQHPRLKGDNIRDIDELSGYFLMDINMGPSFQTSRMKSAILSIQTFVQRCLLGLERKYDIPTTIIDQNSWSWMSRENVWEASRKIFLYPENWADPGLRDDKSDQFVDLENKLNQANITADSVAAAIREYIYTTHEISDLEIQAYFFEKSTGFRGVYHFFGRTRNTPYKIYYRKMTLEGPAEQLAEAYWYPWTLINVEVPAQETYIDGTPLDKPGIYLLPTMHRGRLFLFMPYLTIKSTSKPIQNVTKVTQDSSGNEVQTQSSPTLRNMLDSDLNSTAGSNVHKYWELHMAWVELRNGKWTPKQISQSYVTISETPDAPLPSPENFCFWVRNRNDGEIAIIDAEQIIYQQDTTNSVMFHGKVISLLGAAPQATQTRTASTKPLARFELRGSQMVVETASAPGEEIALQIKFYKTNAVGAEANLWSTPPSGSNTPLFLPGDDLVSIIPKKKNMLVNKWEALMNSYKFGSKSAPQTPVLTFPPFTNELLDNPGHTLSWTFSFNETHYNRPLGLVLERRTASLVESFFGFPFTDFSGAIDDTKSQSITSQRLAHDLSPLLVEKAAGDDIAEIFKLLQDGPAAWVKDAFGGDDKTGYYHELSTPYSIYNWELGFHIIMLLVEWLEAKQQYDLAIQFAKLVFDPSLNDAAPTTTSTTTGSTKQPLSNLESCWQFHPFRNRKLRNSGSVQSIVRNLKPLRGSNLRVQQWRKDPFNPHIIARGRPAVYMRRFVMKYIEILLAKADLLFQDDSMESVAAALQLYIESSHLFGPAPEEIPKPTNSQILSYKDLSGQMNDFSTANVDLELQFPYFVPQTSVFPSNETPTATFSSLQGITRTDYFGIAVNPQILALKGTIDDRLFKARNGLDINGHVRTLALYDPPLDPGQLINAIRSGAGINGALMQDGVGPMPNYRFLWLLQKAYEMCSELKASLDALLSLKEKKDVEALSLLRSRQDMKVQELTAAIKQSSRDECVKSLEVLQDTRNAHVHRLKYYLALIGEPDSRVPTADVDWSEIVQHIDTPQDDELRMSPYENLEMVMADNATTVTAIASGLDNQASFMRLLPHISENVEPLGCGVTTMIDTHNVADFLSASAGVIRSNAELINSVSVKAGRKANLVRQLQERRFQANTAGMDIKNCDRQIEAQKIRLQGIDHEIALQAQQQKDAKEVDDFLNQKYTKQALYDWMDKTVQKTSYDLFQLTIAMARKAEKAFFFERGRQPLTFLQPGYWNATQNGLTSVQTLYNDLKKMESAYVEKPAHDFEMTKSISMKQVSPMSLLKLRETGTTDFTIPEVIFDFDFPGHYGRRIKQVTVSIPCIVGPYTSLSCDVRLISHCYRLEASGSTSNPDYYPANFDAYATDSRFASDSVPIKAIAMSTGQMDGGQFELSFQSERYAPFEGAGVISRWTLSLPPKSMQQFEYRTISDVVFHIRYMSLDGPTAREAAMGAVQQWQFGTDAVKSGSSASFLCDLKNEFPGEWLKISAPDKASAPGGNLVKLLSLQNIRRYLSYWANRDTANILSVKLVIGASQTDDLALAKFQLQSPVGTGNLTIDFQDGVDEIDGTLVRQNSDEYAGKMPVGDLRLQITGSEDAFKNIENIWMVVAYKTLKK
ncbi:hypothetical protein H072_11353 [Dactylellina haptotyla CBS 200.50]|uniref:Toxin subunit n=1 Tax=Dactylellina haptotyla (strain CBS 200.50) TaxID=1284197 RepID=S8BJ34_DACHA|nr:hypothetical protein H072_11353 [Dactylellina haptotyla CBS 200.50]